jgi:hypothetical protein
VRSGDIPLAPNQYRVTLNPNDREALIAQQPDLDNDLAHHLLDLAHQLGFALPYLPTVSLVAQQDVPLHQVRVDAHWRPFEGDTLHDETKGTRQMPLPVDEAAHEERVPQARPFLILEGQRHIEIVSPTVSLGRSLDNDIIVDDSRVSRKHAQLRRRYDRYVIYDLDSTGGTTVNGYPIQECVLEAGDIISLAGVEIIYGEDSPAPTSPTPDTTSTPALGRSSSSETGQLPSLPGDPSQF